MSHISCSFLEVMSLMIIAVQAKSSPKLLALCFQWQVWKVQGAGDYFQKFVETFSKVYPLKSG